MTCPAPISSPGDSSLPLVAPGMLSHCEVAEGNLDIVFATDDDVPCESFCCTAVQLECHILGREGSTQTHWHWHKTIL